VVEHLFDQTPDAPGGGLESEIAALYAELASELLRFAALILQEQDGAGDALQEVFLRYFAERKCGGSITNPRAWLYRVLHNLLMDRLARATLHRQVFADDSADPADSGHSPEEIASQAQIARQVMAGFTARELDCLRLRAEGLSYEETADALGIRSGTVGALLTRVHKKLLHLCGDSRHQRMAIASALWSVLSEGGTYTS